MEKNRTETQEEEKVCCGIRHKERSPEEQRNLILRLKRIEGQIRGIRDMVEGGRYCVDILTQVSAVQSALGSFSKELMEHHIKTCVREDILDGKEEKLEELCGLVRKLMR